MWRGHRVPRTKGTRRHSHARGNRQGPRHHQARSRHPWQQISRNVSLRRETGGSYSLLLSRSPCRDGCLEFAVGAGSAGLWCWAEFCAPARPRCTASGDEEDSGSFRAAFVAEPRWTVMQSFGWLSDNCSVSAPVAVVSDDGFANLARLLPPPAASGLRWRFMLGMRFP